MLKIARFPLDLKAEGTTARGCSEDEGGGPKWAELHRVGFVRWEEVKTALHSEDAATLAVSMA